MKSLKKFYLIILCVTILMSSCTLDGNKLTRSKAEKMIKKVLTPILLVIPTGKGIKIFSTDRRDISKTIDILLALARRNLIKLHPSSLHIKKGIAKIGFPTSMMLKDQSGFYITVDIQLYDKTLKYCLGKINRGETIGENKLIINYIKGATNIISLSEYIWSRISVDNKDDWVVVERAKPIFLNITGIITEENQAKVEFKWEYELTPFGLCLDELGIYKSYIGEGLLTSKTEELKKGVQTGVAMFTLYDDGWRIQSISLK